MNTKGERHFTLTIHEDIYQECLTIVKACRAEGAKMSISEFIETAIVSFILSAKAQAAKPKDERSN